MEELIGFTLGKKIGFEKNPFYGNAYRRKRIGSKRVRKLDFLSGDAVQFAEKMVGRSRAAGLSS
ncbi:MAG: hypothetical protein NWQ21_06975 [Desulfobacterales bacterium]|nr:hypothetical protein [Desulfobacterales bacterium]